MTRFDEAWDLIERYLKARKDFDNGGDWNDNVRDVLYYRRKAIDDFLYENLKEDD